MLAQRMAVCEPASAWRVNSSPWQLLALKIDLQLLATRGLTPLLWATADSDMVWPAGKYSLALNQARTAPVQQCCVSVSGGVVWCPSACTQTLFYCLRVLHCLPPPKVPLYCELNGQVVLFIFASANRMDPPPLSDWQQANGSGSFPVDVETSEGMKNGEKNRERG